MDNKNDNKISMEDLNVVSGGAGKPRLRCRSCRMDISDMVYLANGGLCPSCFLKAHEGLNNVRKPVSDSL